MTDIRASRNFASGGTLILVVVVGGGVAGDGQLAGQGGARGGFAPSACWPRGWVQEGDLPPPTEGGRF